MRYNYHTTCPSCGNIIADEVLSNGDIEELNKLPFIMGYSKKLYFCSRRCKKMYLLTKEEV